MSSRALYLGFVVCFYCWVAAPAQSASLIEQPAPAVVRTQAQWLAVLASGQATPLDALTPYGKRRFIASLQWSRNELGGFGFLPLIRELDVEQLAAALTFVDSARYLQLLRDEIVGAPLRLPGPSADVEQRLERLEQFAMIEAEKRRSAQSSSTTLGAPTLLQRYENLFGDRMKRTALQGQPLGDLPLLFDAAALASAENPGSPAFVHMLLVHQELAARGIDTRRSLDGSILTALIAAREFDQARAFAESRPHLARKRIPKVADPLGPGFNGRTMFQYDVTSNTLTRRVAPDSADIELVMVVDGGCHFSRDALNAIRNDAELQTRLRKANLVLVTPPRSAIDFGFLDGWNTANPSMPIYVPYSVKEWQSFDVAGVPEFYILKNGAVVGRLFSGWPAGGNKAALFKLIDSASK